MAKRKRVTQRSNKKVVSTLKLLNHSIPQLSHRTGFTDKPDNKAHGNGISKTRKLASSKYPELEANMRPILSFDSLEPKEFSRSLDGTQQGIAQDVLDALTLQEQSANKRLTEVVSRDAEKLSLISRQTFEHAPFECGTTSSSDVGLSNVQLDFQETEMELTTLWKEWMKTQREIAYLGVEVMGLEQFEGLGSRRSGVTKEKLNAAISMAREHRKTEENAKSTLRAQEEVVCEITRRMTSSSKDHGKKWKREARKLRGEMYQFAERIVHGN